MHIEQSPYKSITFDSKDIDQEMWEARTLAEATLIFNKESTRQGRTWEQVYSKCRQGQASELWLLSKGFKDDLRPYHDVIHPDGTPIEVKTSKWEARYILNRYAEKLKSRPRDWPNTVYVFHNNPSETLYSWTGIFVWNGKSFIGSRPTL